MMEYMPGMMVQTLRYSEQAGWVVSCVVRGSYKRAQSIASPIMDQFPSDLWVYTTTSSASIAHAQVNLMTCVQSMRKGVSVSDTSLLISMVLRTSDRRERPTFAHSHLESVSGVPVHSRGG